MRLILAAVVLVLGFATAPALAALFMRGGAPVSGGGGGSNCLLISGTTTNCLLISGTSTNALLVK